MGSGGLGRGAAAALHLQPLLLLAAFLLPTGTQFCGCPECQGGFCGHGYHWERNSSETESAGEGCGAVGNRQGEMPQDRHPYMASLRRPGTHDHVCTGVLVHPRFVLTAGHCVDPGNQFSVGNRPIVALGGSPMDDEPKEEVVAASSTIVPGWERTLQRSSSNLALVKLPSPLWRATPIVLSTHLRVFSGQWLEALGWGSTGAAPSLGQPIFSNLKLEEQEAITGKDCNMSTLWDGRIGQGLICGLKRSRRSSCLVDSGSPIMLLDAPGGDVSRGAADLDILIGVNVDGAPCGEFGKPDVYVDVRAQQKWIERLIGRI